MATIESTLQSYDNMYSIISSITSAVNTCISSFESMQSASSQAFNTSSLVTNKHLLSDIKDYYTDIEESMKSIGSLQGDLGKNLSQGQGDVGGFVSKIKDVIGEYATLENLGKVLNLSDQLVQSRTRLDAMNDGLRTTDDLQKMIYQSAQRSGTSYNDNVDEVTKLGTAAKGAFSSNDEMVAFAEQMNKQFKIGGASQEDQTAGMSQITDAMSSGTLQSDGLSTIMENAPQLAQAIADCTGKSVGDLSQMASQGEITADIIKQALFSTADQTDAKFASMPNTIEGYWTSIKNQGLMAFQPVLLKINEIANNPNFSNMVNMMFNGFSLIAQGVLDVINTMVNIGGFFQSNWGIIEPIIWGIVAALSAYLIAIGLVEVAEGIEAVTKGAASLAADIYAASLDYQAGASFVATAAQYGLNAALLACPITWIIIAIIALIVIFYLAIAAIGKFTGQSWSATGIIAGVFMALGAIIYDVFAGIYNVAAAVAEFLINVFNNPVGTAKLLFLGLAIGIIDAMISATKGCDQFATNMANAIIDGINSAIEAWNSFIDLLNQAGIADKLGLGKADKLDHTTSIVSDLTNERDNLQNQYDDAMKNYITVPRVDYLNVGDQFNKGYQGGADFANWAGNLFDFNKQQDNGGFNYADFLKNMGNNTGNSTNSLLNNTQNNGIPNYNDLLNNTGACADAAKATADNTGAMNDNLNVNDEDLKYLRDIAEQDAINRFTTAEVKVQMNNTNHVNSELDLDGIIDSLGQGIYEGIQTVREGATYDV